MPCCRRHVLQGSSEVLLEPAAGEGIGGGFGKKAFADSQKVQMKWKEIILALILVAATWAVYWQVKDHEFVDLDDPAYVADNRAVKKGLNRRTLSGLSPTQTRPTGIL